jgi:hypothetical protein
VLGLERYDVSANGYMQIEFKAAPAYQKLNVTPPTPGADPRTGIILYLFEEFVPAGYRAQLVSAGQAPRRKIDFL